LHPTTLPICYLSSSEFLGSFRTLLEQSLRFLYIYKDSNKVHIQIEINIKRPKGRTTNQITSKLPAGGTKEGLGPEERLLRTISCLPSRLHGRIADTFAQVFIRWIVREPPELVLHRLRQSRISDNRVLCFLIGEIRVEVRNVEDGFLEKAIGQCLQ